jgi:uncharacterized oligopeptide transporter (OPT) family protein
MSQRARRFLPPLNSRAYHLLLAVAALFVLGPLGGISAAFMNFSIGVYVGGQVLAGILGSAVTLPYGPEGKHGANYIQTMAASVAGMCAMAPLIQAMTWLGLPTPPAWQLVLYFLCIGMFGVGVGMLYTPIVVDRLQLTYPSGLAVANILRALTDPQLLRRSIANLATSICLGLVGSLATAKSTWLAACGLSASTLGGGMIVGARIAIPPLVVALIGRWQTPHLIEMGWLNANEPYRKIGFIISLGSILGAASLDLVLILIETFRRWRAQQRQVSANPEPPAADWKRVNLLRLIVWVVIWGVGTLAVGSQILHQPIGFLTVAVVLCFIFVLTNGIALGVSDFNPISSAFVMSVFILAALGLRDPGVGLLCAAVLAISTAEGGDMQQDRSTGWRLGTNRIFQFRYQVIGIAGGAILAVVLAKVFMTAFPILTQDQFANPNLEGAKQWQSAFTYKMVGALRGITRSQPHVMKALQLGIAVGLLIEIARKLLQRSLRYRQFSTKSPRGRVTSFVLDAVVLPSPYAYAFGGFVEIITVLWWTAGGILASSGEWIAKRVAIHRHRRQGGHRSEDIPDDMSGRCLMGGGLIAGDAIGALAMGVSGLVRTIF